MFKSIQKLGLCLLTFLFLVSAFGSQSNNDVSGGDIKAEESTTTPSDNTTDEGIIDEVDVNIAKIEGVLENEPFYPEMGVRADEFGKPIYDWNREGAYMILEHGQPTGMGSSPIDGLLSEIKYEGYEIAENNGGTWLHLIILWILMLLRIR